MGLAGCRPVHHKSKEPAAKNPLLGTYRMAPNSVALEVALVEFDSAEYDRILNESAPYLDSGRIPLEQRQRWDVNGLQVGVWTSHIPGVLRDAVEVGGYHAGESVADAGVAASFDSLRRSPILFHRRMQFKAGEPRPIPVSDYYPQAAWEVKLNDGRSLRTESNVRGWMLVAIDLGRGETVDLRIVPRITHGAVTKRIAVAQQSFINEETQSEIDLNDLAVNLTLAPGDTLLVCSRAEAGEVGDLMFGNGQAAIGSGDQVSSARLLMIRLIQSQHNDLFTPPDFK